MLQETIKKQKLINFGKKNKRLYMYFRVQKNSSKGVLFNQYKTVSKSLYDIGSYFKQVNAGLNLSTEDQARSLYILSNYNKFNVFMLKKKIHYNFNFLNKYEFQTFFSYLDGFKKNRLSNAFWKISKSFYFSKFYLSRIKANFYETLFYKRSTQEFKRKVVVHFPLNGNLKSTFNQYNYRYLKHLERTISITNKIYRKFRNNWTKDFFSYHDHLKIFSLIQKKLYYNIKLNQKVDLKMLKIKLTDNLKIKKQKIINNVVLNKHKKLSVNKWQLIVLKYYNQLQINLKDFIFLNNKNKKLRYFLKFFLKYNFNYNSLDITKHFFLQDVSKYKMVSSSIFFSNSNLYKNVEYNPILKNQILIRFYNSWLKLFLWNFNFFKKNIFSDYISSSDNFQNFNTQASLVHKVIENKNKDKFYFGKFLKYFNEKTDETSFFQVYNLKDLIDPKFTVKSIQFFQNFFFFFLTNTKNTKNLLIISSAIKNIFKMRILSFIEKYDCKNSLVFNNNFFYKPISMKLLYFPIFVYFVINFLIFKIYRIKNNYFFRKKNYTVIPMIRNKKFLFWLEQQFEKHFKMNFKLNYISATKAISKFYRNGTNFYFSYAKKIFFYRFFQGWRQQSIYADIMWIILIAIKYYSSSFLSNMLAEQIVKRKKQWPFIKIVKAIIRDILPKSMVDNPIKIDGLRIGINGKINGRDRSINYLMWKYFKDRQISKIHPIYLKVDYSLSTANSKYGIFGLRVWISRF